MSYWMQVRTTLENHCVCCFTLPNTTRWKEGKDSDLYVWSGKSSCTSCYALHQLAWLSHASDTAVFNGIPLCFCSYCCAKSWSKCLYFILLRCLLLQWWRVSQRAGRFLCLHPCRTWRQQTPVLVYVLLATIPVRWYTHFFFIIWCLSLFFFCLTCWFFSCALACCACNASCRCIVCF